MRNPARIYPLLNKIGDLWIKHPDLRFGQLIENIKRLDKTTRISNDLFFIEDDEFEKLIDKFGDKINAKSH